MDVIGNYTAFGELLGRGHEAPLRVVVVYPDLLGTYGDGGNGLILTRRAQWRGIEAELAQASSDAPLPEADIYCLGGGEDGPQVRAARALIDDRTLVRRVDAGAVVLAVCAGYQIVGTTFPGADGTPHEGVGLLGLTTSKGVGSRAVGEVTAEVRRRPCTVDAAHLDRVRKPWRCHHVGRGHHAPGPGDAWVSATATVRAPRAPSPAGWWEPTCTGRSWPAIQ